MSTLETLINRFEICRAVVGIVGLGYVGLSLMLRFQAVGFRVIGIDVDPRKIEKLNQYRACLILWFNGLWCP